jgi:hypothetical protein
VRAAGAIAFLTVWINGTAALAAPTWEIKLRHLNAYGQTCTEGAKAEANTEALTACGEDHLFLGFGRESGDNAYRITVSNSASPGPSANAVNANATVTVTDTLPPGLALAGPSTPAEGEGWRCGVEAIDNPRDEYRPRLVTCQRDPGESGLAPQAPYPPILLHVYVEGASAVPGASVLDTATVTGGGADPESASTSEAEGTTPIEEAVKFGFHEFAVQSLGGEEATAGGHPDELKTTLEFNYSPNYDGQIVGAGGGADEFGVGPKSVEVTLPPGLLGNPQLQPACRLDELRAAVRLCPNTAVGYIEYNYTTGSLEYERPAKVRSAPLNSATSLIYNLVPPPGHAAAFGFTETQAELPFVLYAQPRAGETNSYAVEVGTTAAGPLRGAVVTFCSYGVVKVGECAAPQSQSKPFLTNPTECSATPDVKVAATSWREPAAALVEGLTSIKTDLLGHSATFEKCSALSYKRTNLEPKVEVAPTGDSSDPTNESSEEPKLLEQISGDVPTGVTIVLKVPQSETRALATPAPNKLTMKLPKGLVLSPSAAEGLVACSAEEFNLHDESEGECPSASGLGTVEVFTPLLPTPTGVGVEAHKPSEGGQLKGELYLGQVNCPNCTKQEIEEGQLLHLYLEVKDPKAGLTVKLEGHSALNSEGQVITTFENLPRLPFSELIVKLRGGQRAPLASSQTCESAEPALITLNPWGEKEASSSSGASTPPGALPFSTSSSNNFSVACSAAAFKPQFEAGTEYPQAGHYSDFLLRFSRHDGEGDLSGLELHTPPGLTAKLAGVPTCGEPQASEGECPQDSEIGTVAVSAGSGTKPFIQTGQVYLTGPYNGSEAKGEGSCTANGAPECAPYGLSIVVPTQAGPFKLAGNTGKGKEVTRAKIEVNESTAAVNVKSNPLPSELDGVQLRIKEVQIDVNRKDFYLNPTNCEKTSISADITAENQGIEPAVSERAEGSSSFDVGGCRGLSFKPTLTAYTKSNTSKAGGASLNVKLSQRSGEANIHKVELQLPIALPSRLETLNHACSEKQFAEDPWKCPAAAFVGGATAHTPLLSVPLTGRAVLVSHAGAAFPDVDFLLFGQGISIHLVGHTNIKNGITYSKFETVPDQPITSFEANLPIGPHSILAANGYLCTQNLKMPTTITAQNGAVLTQKTQITVRGCPPKKARIATVTGETSTTAPWHAGDSPSGLTGSLTTNASQSATVARPAVSGNCKNESSRAESDWNEAIVAPYSEGLPECRAYEMVSPVEKQGQGVSELTLVSPSGDAAGFISEGAFSDPSNFSLLGAVVRNSYVARRSSGEGGGRWETSSAFAPVSLIEAPNLGAPLASDFAPELQQSSQAACGVAPSGGDTCAARGEAWPSSAPSYWPTDGLTAEQVEEKGYLDIGEGIEGAGDTARISRVFLEPQAPVIPTDTIPTGGLYELDLTEGDAARPRLVNLSSGGEELKLDGTHTPLLGDSAGKDGSGTSDHAVSEDGEYVFFTATPSGGPAQTVYARVRAEETVAVSAPQGCVGGESRCTAGEEGRATFQGASAGGTKVFFTTEQQLLPGHSDTTTKLYEYDFSGSAGARLTELSAGSEEAQVEGVVRTSADGSHVYFVARGVLTEADAPNVLNERPREGEDNLYVADTDTGEVKFIATLPARDKALWGRGCGQSSEGVACDNPEGSGAGGSGGASEGRYAQSTPDGDYLVFSTYAHLGAGEASPPGEAALPGDENGCTPGLREQGEAIEVCNARAVYRYDASTGALTWLSHSSSWLTDAGPADEGSSALIEPLNGNRDGAMAYFEDGGRAISAGAHAGVEDDGRYVIFTSSERLQPDDVGGRSAPQVYLWRCSQACTHPGREGEVVMISDGHAGAGTPAMSESGGDIFFTTSTALVPGDEDDLTDLYDARVEGGAEPPPTPRACETACPVESTLAPFGPLGSLSFTAGQNLPARRG